MKTIEELDISYLPWKQGCFLDKLVLDRVGGVVAEARNEYDARLIALAPDLYEALAAMLSCAEKESPFTMESGMSIAMDMARKAIEKAGGVE